MNRRWAGVAIACAVLVAMAAAFWLWRPAPARPAPPAPTGVAPAAVSLAAPLTDRWMARLYLPDASDRLAVLELEVESGGSAAERARATLEALLAARPEAPLQPLFPTPVEPGKLLLGEDGTAYVDLRAAGSGNPPDSGSTVELLRVYSLVHTLLRNVPEIHRVVLLWNGIQRTSLAGHVDTAHALGLRPELEAR